jgi:hypothetical protein
MKIFCTDTFPRALCFISLMIGWRTHADDRVRTIHGHQTVEGLWVQEKLIFSRHTEGKENGN